MGAAANDGADDVIVGGTCRIGADAASAVDPALRVRGVAGLRVIDASIMPTMPRADTNAPVIGVAETGADPVRQG